MEIEIQENNDKSKYDNADVHMLPCNIDYEGSAPIRSYFKIKSNNSQANETITSHFRGRELLGKRINLPPNVQGINAIHSKKKNDVSWNAVDKFNHFTMWEHDVIPNVSIWDELFDWFEVAEEIHSSNTENQKNSPSELDT